MSHFSQQALNNRLYQLASPATPQRSLADKLASLPTTRHVDIIKLGESPVLYASYLLQGKRVILYLGQDTNLLITRWQQEQSRREEAHRLRVVVRQENRQKRCPDTCKSGHESPSLQCDDCISRAKVQAMWNRGAK